MSFKYLCSVVTLLGHGSVTSDNGSEWR